MNAVIVNARFRIAIVNQVVMLRMIAVLIFHKSVYLNPICVLTVLSYVTSLRKVFSVHVMMVII